MTSLRKCVICGDNPTVTELIVDFRFLTSYKLGVYCSSSLSVGDTSLPSGGRKAGGDGNRQSRRLLDITFPRVVRRASMSRQSEACE